jgi:predicted MFS family arabinose efflux permease
VPAPGHSLGIRAGLGTPALVRPAVVFAATTTAAGVVVTFVPIAVTRDGGNLAALGLFGQAIAATASRWWAGRYGDRRGPARLLVPAVLLTALGILALALTADPVVVVAGMVLFGTGFGVAQNATLALMFDRVPAGGYGTVSALWNLAYDGGLGLGAAGFGLLASGTGYPAGFAVTAALVLAASLPALLDRAASRPVPS